MACGAVTLAARFMNWAGNAADQAVMATPLGERWAACWAGAGRVEGYPEAQPVAGGALQPQLWAGFGVDGRSLHFFCQQTSR